MKKIFIRFKSGIKNFIDYKALRILSLNLTRTKYANVQKSTQFIDWINEDLMKISNDFVEKFVLNKTSFVKNLNFTFKTNRFDFLLKRWSVDYISNLYILMYDSSHNSLCSTKSISLEDNPLNKFAVEQYNAKFGNETNIIWIQKENLFKRLFSIFNILTLVILISLKNGIKSSGQKKKFRLMREALWGLYDKGGYFFHDDFLVDGKLLKKNDLLLFSRNSIRECNVRLNAYNDAKKSEYAHFFLPSLKIDIDSFFKYIYPKYIVKSSMILLKELKSSNFSFFLNVFWFFVN